MTTHYNKSSEKLKRLFLRQNQTTPEAILWQHLRNKKMCGLKFKRQYSIDGFVVDFYAPKIKLAIEVDGKNHDRPLQKEYDEIREEYIRNAGITFARFTNQQIEDDIISVLNEISELNTALRNTE